MLFCICRANFKKRVCKVVAVLAILSYLAGKLNSVGRRNMFHLDKASCAALLIFRSLSCFCFYKFFPWILSIAIRCTKTSSISFQFSDKLKVTFEFLAYVPCVTIIQGQFPFQTFSIFFLIIFSVCFFLESTKCYSISYKMLTNIYRKLLNQVIRSYFLGREICETFFKQYNKTNFYLRYSFCWACSLLAINSVSINLTTS